MSLFVRDGSGGYLWSTPSANNGIETTWKHVVMIYNGDKIASNCKFVIDGVLESTTVINDTLVGSCSNTDSFLIAKSDVNYSSVKITRLNVHSRALTVLEAQALYNNGVPITATEVGLIDSLELDLKMFGSEDTATTIKDYSGNGYDGTLVNMDLTNKSSDTP